MIFYLLYMVMGIVIGAITGVRIGKYLERERTINFVMRCYDGSSLASALARGEHDKGDAQ